MRPVLLSFNVAAAMSAALALAAGTKQLGPAREAYCSMVDTTTLYSRDIGRVPNYFFRPLPSSNKVAYSSGAQNYVLDLETGEELRVPEKYDAVPTPDEKWLTIPTGDAGDSMGFYPLDLLLAALGKKEPTPEEKAEGKLTKYDKKVGGIVELEVYRDPNLTGVYQSIGGIDSRKPGEYRIISDKDGLSVREYIDEGGKIQPKGQVQPLCKDKELSLPMLSKDGSELSGLDFKNPDPAKRTTKIWKLKDGKCVDPPEDLGIATGKVDFSWESNDLIAFHASTSRLGMADYIEVPSDAMAANVYVMNRKTHELFRLTHNTNSNSMYPAFRRDGKLIYVSHPNSESAQMPKFVVADPTRTKAISMDFILKAKCDTPDESRKFHAVLALGTLWTQVCSSYAEKTSPSAAMLFSLSLDSDQCKALVQAKWASYRELVLKSNTLSSAAPKLDPKMLDELTPKDLLAACPKERLKGKVKRVEEPAADFPKMKKKVKHDSVVPTACAGCHPGRPFADPELLNAPSKTGTTLCQTVRERMARAPDKFGAMPMGYIYWPAEEKAAFDEQKSAFEAYLKKICP